MGEQARPPRVGVTHSPSPPLPAIYTANLLPKATQIPRAGDVMSAQPFIIVFQEIQN